MARNLSTSWIKKSIRECLNEGTTIDRSAYGRAKIVQVLKGLDDLSVLVVSDQNNYVAVFLTTVCAEDLRRMLPDKTLNSLRNAVVKLEKWHFSSLIISGGNRNEADLSAGKLTRPVVIQANKIALFGVHEIGKIGSPIDLNLDKQMVELYRPMDHARMIKRLQRQFPGEFSLPDAEGKFNIPRLYDDDYEIRLDHCVIPHDQNPDREGQAGLLESAPSGNTAASPLSSSPSPGGTVYDEDEDAEMGLDNGGDFDEDDIMVSDREPMSQLTLPAQETTFAVASVVSPVVAQSQLLDASGSPSEPSSQHINTQAPFSMTPTGLGDTQASWLSRSYSSQMNTQVPLPGTPGFNDEHYSSSSLAVPSSGTRQDVAPEKTEWSQRHHKQLIGRRVKKTFFVTNGAQREFYGTIGSCQICLDQDQNNIQKPYFRVRYTDGDIEDLEIDDAMKILLDDDEGFDVEKQLRALSPGDTVITGFRDGDIITGAHVELDLDKLTEEVVKEYNRMHKEKPLGGSEALRYDLRYCC